MSRLCPQCNRLRVCLGTCVAVMLIWLVLPVPPAAAELSESRKAELRSDYETICLPDPQSQACTDWQASLTQEEAEYVFTYYNEPTGESGESDDVSGPYYEGDNYSAAATGFGPQPSGHVCWYQTVSQLAKNRFGFNQYKYSMRVRWCVRISTGGIGSGNGSITWATLYDFSAYQYVGELPGERYKEYAFTTVKRVAHFMACQPGIGWPCYHTYPWLWHKGWNTGASTWDGGIDGGA